MIGETHGNTQVINLTLEDVNMICWDYFEKCGGICGVNSSGTISNCSSTVNVTCGENPHALGGLCGRNRSTISNCYATGNVTGGFSSSALGGLCGNNNSTVSNCYAKGSVIAGDDSERIGGLCGNNEGGTISNCYATGVVDGNDYVGGLIGRDYDENGFFTKCFWDSDINPSLDGIGNSTDPNVIGKTTSEMLTESTFTNWDFSNVWAIYEKQVQSYPLLRQRVIGDLNCDRRVDMVDFAIFGGHWMEGVE